MDEEPAERMPKTKAPIKDFTGFKSKSRSFRSAEAAMLAIDENAPRIKSPRVVLHEGAEGVKGRASVIAWIKSPNGDERAPEKPVRVKAGRSNPLLEKMKRISSSPWGAFWVFLEEGAVKNFGAAVFRRDFSYVSRCLPGEEPLAGTEELNINPAGEGKRLIHGSAGSFPLHPVNIERERALIDGPFGRFAGIEKKNLEVLLFLRGNAFKSLVEEVIVAVC